ncbi:uncharacterized protein LOC130743278 [Lotus japonicus]|uniref:uncharacterized protein LOC130743278 n=1 Tax=Lotus japonicus TaxID=34305 RepID=UPI00258CB907|nr:uncharacterized protein LOC130743278 [Lotus japonicus]
MGQQGESMYTDEENSVLDVSHILATASAAKDGWLVGRLLTEGSCNLRGLKGTLVNIWRSFGRHEFRELGPNLFTIRFHDKADRDRLMLAGPWTFDQFLLVLKELEVDETPSQVPLQRVPFWVQVHDIPVGLHTEEMARSLGNALGGFLGWDSTERRNHGGYLRIRVSVDVTKPLLRSKLLGRGANKEPLRVLFRYERLANLCYRCGRMDHFVKHCSSKERGPFPFGPCMKAEVVHSFTSRNRASSSFSSRGGAAYGTDSGSSSFPQYGPSSPLHGSVHGGSEVGEKDGNSVLTPKDVAVTTVDFGGSGDNHTVPEGPSKKRSAGTSLDDAMVLQPPSKKMLFDAISADAAEQVRRAQ